MIASVADEMTYANFPKEYKEIVARIVISHIKLSNASLTNYNLKQQLYDYLTK